MFIFKIGQSIEIYLFPRLQSLKINITGLTYSCEEPYAVSFTAVVWAHHAMLGEGAQKPAAKEIRNWC